MLRSSTAPSDVSRPCIGSGDNGTRSAHHLDTEPFRPLSITGPDGIAPQPTVKPVSKAYVAVREDVAKTHWVYTTFTNEAR